MLLEVAEGYDRLASEQEAFLTRMGYLRPNNAN